MADNLAHALRAFAEQMLGESGAEEVHLSFRYPAYTVDLWAEREDGEDAQTVVFDRIRPVPSN